MVKQSILILGILLLAGCSTYPPLDPAAERTLHSHWQAQRKEVADAWRGYCAVKKGMTREEVHALVGVPTRPDNHAEEWLVGQPFELGGYSASLCVIYGPDGRVTQIDRWRYHSPRPRYRGVGYAMATTEPERTNGLSQ